MSDGIAAKTSVLDGKVAFVTGGSRGIGAAVAVRLAEEGADVALSYQRDAGAADAVQDRIRAIGRRGLVIQADSADPAAVVAAVDRTAGEFGRLDILVNNAGAFLLGPVAELGLAEFEQTVAVNVRAPFVAAQAAARHMVHGGRIITIGSNVAERTPFPGFALYSMSKTAMTGLAKGLGRDLGPRGITVNVVNPGPTDTELNPADSPMAETIRGHTAVGRYATPVEIAAAVAWLAAPDSGYVTGASINVDGGFTI
ncbi:SDR family NAD(P)-dependent oxidoreductase [Plantactinospora sp. WMMB782]|uniref:SDR family NAD(P)-dependent oxidoreductase n=1 Tax=Plantactinospora sp. WMMB782 TaxID=3404121 RepID=UPI003B924D5B